MKKLIVALLIVVAGHLPHLPLTWLAVGWLGLIGTAMATMLRLLPDEFGRSNPHLVGHLLLPIGWNDPGTDFPKRAAQDGIWALP